MPALGDCVMAARESAVQSRGRGWSQLTSSASDEQIVFQGNRLEHPIRQPKNAPPEPATQKDEGFAQFLKTHSSPNHTRVTAGGRIVPMEKRSAPPRFALSASKSNQNTGSAQLKSIESVSKPATSDMDRFIGHQNGVSSPDQANVFGYGIGSNTTLLPSIAPELLPPTTSALNLQQAALESNIMMQNQILSYGHGLSSGTLYRTVPAMTAEAPIYSPQHPISFPYLPYTTSFVQPSIATSSLPTAYGAEPPLLSMLQVRLNEANNNFEVYQQQLRDLDRYRATHPRDDTLISQRVQIVARRAEIKEEIRRLQAAITVNERNATQQQSLQQKSGRGIPLTIKVPDAPKDQTPKPKSASKLNVAAAAYVPKAIGTQSASELRQPTFVATHYSRIDTSTGSPELKCTDGWNNRLGDPPAQLLREQSLMAEHLLSELNTPKVSDDDTSDHSSTESCRFTGLDSPADPHHRAPPAIEAECGRLLDAMRKPKGMATPVTLSDGRMQVVAGLDLKPPSPENMTDFENAYWNRKPAHPDFSSYGNKENSRAPSFTAKTSTFSFENSVLSQDQAKPYRGSLHELVTCPKLPRHWLIREKGLQVARPSQISPPRSATIPNPWHRAPRTTNGTQPFANYRLKQPARPLQQPTAKTPSNQCTPPIALFRRHY